MKKKYENKMREIEIATADLWLSTGAIEITNIGDENTYYANEWGHEFFCKNYPKQENDFHLPRPGDHAAEIATLKNLITMIEIDHVLASDFAQYDCLGLIPDTKEAKIIHLQSLIIAELENALA